MSRNRVSDILFAQSGELKAIREGAFSVLFFCAFFALYIRGLFEVTIGKLLGYGLQAGLWTLVQFTAVAFFRHRMTNLFTAGIALTLLFGLSAVVSSFLTMYINGFSGGIITTAVNVYFLFLFVVGYGFRTEAFSAKPIALSMAAAGILLPMVGALQTFFYIAELPGRSLARTPSVTGSYLHFPLLCGVLAIGLLEAARSLRWWLLYPISALCFFGVAISGGRSGMLVLAGTGALFVIFEISRRPAGEMVKFSLIALAVVAVIAVSLAVAYQFSPGLQRLGRFMDLNEEGNALRVVIWKEIYLYWTQTNLWFGEYTGLVGNTTTNAVGEGSTLVAESGALQQLINFGLVGFISFYIAMLLSYLAIEKTCTYLRALFISAMVQTAFYQSTEVLPYMAMLAFLPALSQSMRAAADKPKLAFSFRNIWKRLSIRG